MRGGHHVSSLGVAPCGGGIRQRAGEGTSDVVKIATFRRRGKVEWALFLGAVGAVVAVGNEDCVRRGFIAGNVISFLPVRYRAIVVTIPHKVRQF